MIIQLHSPIWLWTTKGEGICHFLIDHGLETELFWVVFIQDTCEIWTMNNTEVRAIYNKTVGRIPKEFKMKKKQEKKMPIVIKKKPSAKAKMKKLEKKEF